MLQMWTSSAVRSNPHFLFPPPPLILPLPCVVKSPPDSPPPPSSPDTKDPGRRVFQSIELSDPLQRSVWEPGEPLSLCWHQLTFNPIQFPVDWEMGSEEFSFSQERECRGRERELILDDARNRFVARSAVIFAPLCCFSVDKRTHTNFILCNTVQCLFNNSKSIVDSLSPLSCDGH